MMELHLSGGAMICCGMLAAWWLLYSLAGLWLMHEDKRRARTRRLSRVPEKVLFLLAATGGATGIWAGMYLFRHKTQHRSFVIGIPLIWLVQMAAFGIAFWYCLQIPI